SPVTVGDFNHDGVADILWREDATNRLETWLLASDVSQQGASLQGGVGPDTFMGSADADSMAGGAGDDTYIVDNADDQVSEAPNEGTDTVISWFDYQLEPNVEKLVLQEGSNAVTATGNELDNDITGNANNDIIDGGAGADRMAGGLGDDT